MVEKHNHTGKIIFPLRSNNAKEKPAEIACTHVSKRGKLDTCRFSLNEEGRVCVTYVKSPGSFLNWIKVYEISFSGMLLKER